VSVQSNPAFRIISTQIEAVHTTGGYDGIVNTGQAFKILVILENGVGQTVKNIQVRIATDGHSEITDDADTLIQSLRPTAHRDTVTYRAVADTAKNSTEIFSAKIIQAFFENTDQAVPIGASLDSTAKVTIQSPARIALELTQDNPQGMVSTRQKFIVRAELQNLGTSELDGMAVVQLNLPEGFSRAPESPSDTLNIGLKNSVEWTVVAPSVADDGEYISATLLGDRIPDVCRKTGKRRPSVLQRLHRNRGEPVECSADHRFPGRRERRDSFHRTEFCVESQGIPQLRSGRQCADSTSERLSNHGRGRKKRAGFSCDMADQGPG
jgi:hypothetical protein